VSKGSSFDALNDILPKNRNKSDTEDEIKKENTQAEANISQIDKYRDIFKDTGLINDYGLSTPRHISDKFRLWDRELPVEKLIKDKFDEPEKSDESETSEEEEKTEGMGQDGMNFIGEANDKLQDIAGLIVDAWDIATNGVGKGIDDAKDFYKFSTLEVMENRGRSSLVQRRFAQSVDDYLPWTKGLSRASGGVDIVGNILDGIDTGAHMYIDIVDNIEKDSSFKIFVGDAAGELVILAANRSVDSAAGALGMLGGGAVGGAVGSTSPDPITTIGGAKIGGTIGKCGLPAIAGFTMGHYIDKTYSNGLTGRESLKGYIIDKLKGK